jgi:hypothetical protein
MTSSTGRPSSPPLALTSSRQISSAVLITLLGAAPAPVSARLMPIRIGLPLCADAPEIKPSPMTSAAPRRRSALRQSSIIFSSLDPGSGGPPFGIALRRRFIGAALFPTCAFPPAPRRPNSLPHLGLASRPLAAAAGHGARAAVRSGRAPRPAYFTLLPHNFHVLAETRAHNTRGAIAWGNRGCISWPLSGPSEPPCRTAAIDLSCTTCAARGRSGSSVTADSLLESFRRSAWPVPFRHGRRQPFVRREALRRDPYRVSRSSPSCPAKAGHPVITEYLVVTGSPAFAGDDDKEATDRTKNHHALDAYAAAAARLRTLSIREARSK